MLEFRVELRRTAACAVVDVAGELDIATAPELVAALSEATDSGANRIVVNLLATTFIDSSGLTTLFRAHKAHPDGEFSIVCAQENLEVWRVMDLMGFTDVFTIHETLADANCDATAAVATSVGSSHWISWFSLPRTAAGERSSSRYALAPWRS